MWTAPYSDGNLCDKASLAGVVVGGASDDAALDAPSPLSPTHQLYLKNLLIFEPNILYLHILEPFLGPFLSL